ncbi:MAG: hypothetical protein EOS73_33355 [Mesorhizobium sp.]|uniref:hypothetical protein n=1 Tax=Mesorhizobium sp. M7A.F.Ca.ET.027.02.1.1 TaxID=2496655 RepID=UPI000FD1A6F3|nr:hypothetical protein [Mesorhizobium sp. M7A.F.Ca.ET.027.02.1.1]RVD04798.1 hypothetical protein EN749_35305 [Mesorhizobium sp. M7A.F.Ca.ET.027.02.1.1]RWC96707.1 MAG: hypothetical protein EOS73_33355 [Mesorhizobium sp.]
MMRPFRFANLGAVGALAALIAVPFPGVALAQTASAQPAPAQPAPQAEPAAPAQAAPKLETFGRWSTLVDEVDTGEDLRKTCAASTAFIGAGGVPGTLTLVITNGDALPPDAYPSITIAVDNKGLPAGKSIAATFGDDKGRVAAKLHSDGAVNGRLSWTVDNQAKTSLALLRAMRRASVLDVSFGDAPVGSISMDGFTKAYRSLGASCGFPTADVAP